MPGRWSYGKQYYQERVWANLCKIRAMKSIKITLYGLPRNCRLLGVDTKHTRSQEFGCDPSSKWWSHKFNGPGVLFEVVTDPVEGKIRWINGPQPASIHDITFLRGGKKGKEMHWKRSALYFNIPAGVKLVGDSAYKGQADKVTTTKDAHDPETKIFLLG